jgi:hypothetical protein
MSSQKSSASQREALWLAHEKKCAYTREASVAFTSTTSFLKVWPMILSNLSE